MVPCIYASVCLSTCVCLSAEIPYEKRYNIWLSMRHLRSVILPCEILNKGRVIIFVRNIKVKVNFVLILKTVEMHVFHISSINLKQVVLMPQNS